MFVLGVVSGSQQQKWLHCIRAVELWDNEHRDPSLLPHEFDFVDYCLLLHWYELTRPEGSDGILGSEHLLLCHIS